MTSLFLYTAPYLWNLFLLNLTADIQTYVVRFSDRTQNMYSELAEFQKWRFSVINLTLNLCDTILVFLAFFFKIDQFFLGFWSQNHRTNFTCNVHACNTSLMFIAIINTYTELYLNPRTQYLLKGWMTHLWKRRYWSFLVWIWTYMLKVSLLYLGTHEFTIWIAYIYFFSSFRFITYYTKVYSWYWHLNFGLTIFMGWFFSTIVEN